jgi:hypothetical protein
MALLKIEALAFLLRYIRTLKPRPGDSDYLDNISTGRLLVLIDSQGLVRILDGQVILANKIINGKS